MFGRIFSAACSVMPTRRGVVWGLIVVGVLVAALLAAIAAAPLLVNGEVAKASIERQLTALIGGDFRYATLDVKVWPLPTAELRQATFRLPPVIEATAERIVLRIAFLPLLKGDVRISTLRLDRPAVVVRLPPSAAEPFPDDPVAAYRNAVEPALKWLAVHARGLELSIRDGTVHFYSADTLELELEALALDGEVASDSIEAKLVAHSKSWKRAEAHAKITTESLASSLELAIEDLEAGPVLERLLGESSIRLHPAATDLKLAAQTDGLRSATAQVSVAMPALGLTRSAARVEIGASRVRLNSTYAPGDSVLIVEELTLGDWLTGATGSLKARGAPGGIVLEAKARRIDAGRLRVGASEVAMDLPPVRALTAIVKAGLALDVHVGATVANVQALADLSAYDVSMGVEGATFDVPVPPMELTGTSGKLRIVKSVLSARDVAATFGASRLSGGEIALALEPVVALRTLSAALDFDLAENHARIAYLLRKTAIARELDRIVSIAGRGKGTLALKEEGGRLREVYDVTSVKSTLRHAGVPLPVAIDSGGLRSETGGPLLLRKVAGSIGSSRVEGLDAEIVFAPGAILRAASGTAALNLDELSPWILALPAAHEVRRVISGLQGAVDVKLARLSGPLYALDGVSAVLTPRKVRVASPLLPDRGKIDGGTLRLEDKDVLFDEVDVEMQDGRGMLSGSVRAYATPARSLDISIVRATLGARSLEWIEDKAEVAPGARLQAPVVLDRARVRWPLPLPWTLDVSAVASFRNGAHTEVDLRSRPGNVQVRRLTLKDQDSDARAVFDWQPERAVVSFHGFVSGRSIGRILATPISGLGTLRGDFDATVDFREPARSRATGSLDGTNVSLPIGFDRPVEIDRVALEASGERVRIRDAVLKIADEPLTLTGSLTSVGDGFDVDAEIAAGGIDGQRWLAWLRSDAAPAEPAASPWRPPLRGKVAVRAKYLDVLGYRLEPFAASMQFKADSLVAEVTEARLCGIPVPFKLAVTGKKLDLEVHAVASMIPVAASAACLSKDSFNASGTMDIRADFTASGAPSALLTSLRGSAQLRARDGRVGGVRALSGVLEVDEVSRRLPKAELDSSREGIGYTAIEIDARLAAEKMTIERALFESRGLNVAMQGEVGLRDRQVALTGIALPIVNTILRNVPIVGRVVGDPIVGIPISVSGDIADPKVSRIGAGAIAGALVNTLQAVVSLPVQLLGAGTGAGTAVPPASNPP